MMSPDKKSTLFCPDCDHYGPMATDWSRSRRDSREELECPDCGTVVVSQPQFGTADDGPMRVALAACAGLVTLLAGLVQLAGFFSVHSR